MHAGCECNVVIATAHNVIWSLHFYVVTTLHSQRCHNQNTTLSQRCHNVILFAGYPKTRYFMQVSKYLIEKKKSILHEKLLYVINSHYEFIEGSQWY